MNYVGKKDKIGNMLSLKEHSIKVSKNAISIANKMIMPEILKDEKNIFIENIRIAGLLHDIGKITKTFQNYIINGKKSKKFKLHNVIGWAFLMEYLNYKKYNLKYVVDATYWHHGINSQMNKDNVFSVLSECSDSDIENMKIFVKELVGDDYIINDGNNNNLKKSPPFYVDDININRDNILIRYCLISADRLIIKNGETLDYLIERENNIQISSNYKYPKLNNERTNEQLNIIKKCNKTTSIAAPAGFGKTMIGLLNNIINSKRKLIWVTPRNMVAKSAYNSIIEGLKKVDIELKVELYLTGEVVKSNYDLESTNEEYCSDIIVTNIDNYLNSTSNNNTLNRLFTILSNDVVFDEYHEFIGETAMFSCFINILKCRHELLNVNTLLLSATPAYLYNINDNFINGINKIKFLPEKYSHYPAIHNKKYNFNFFDNKHKFDEEITVGLENSVSLLNTVRNAQEQHTRLNSSMLVHSKFNKNKRNDDFIDLIKLFGKKSKINNLHVTGTHIMEASLDISFQHTQESILSPDSTVQRVGRNNRFGYNDSSFVNIFKLKNVGEKLIIQTLFDIELNDFWFNYLRNNIDKPITLDRLYVYYNRFIEKYKNEYNNLLINKHMNSINELLKIYPYKYMGKNNNKKRIKSTSNKLRSFGDEIFYICPIYNDEKKYSDVFSERIRKGSWSKSFKENRKYFMRALKRIKKIKDERFDYDDLLKKEKYKKENFTIDDLRSAAIYNDTPYIRLDIRYHPILGIVGIKDFGKLGL